MNYSKAFKFSKDYFAVDGSIAGQNMILAAWSLGIGSVWLGTWPQMDRVLGKMGHSERQGENRFKNVYGEMDQKLFEAGVDYFKGGK